MTLIISAQLKVKKHYLKFFKMILLSLLWSFIIQKAAGAFESMILLHDTITNIKAVTDLEITQHLDTFSPFVRNPSTVVFLCPAETEEQLNSDIVSYYKDILFIKKAFSDIENVQSSSCQYDFKPSFVRISANTWEVGYRIYMENDYEDETKFIKSLKNYYGEEDVYWYLILEIKSHDECLRTMSVTHGLYARMNSDDYSKKCFNYNFRKDILGGIEIYKFYEKENQNKLFENFNPSVLPTYGYFAMHQLAPMQDNMSNVVNVSYCTYFNTTPLWQRVSEGPVRKVEEFIRKVADIFGYILVQTKVNGNLLLPSINGNKMTEVFLQTPSYEHRKISVSSVFSKSLQYSVEISDKPSVIYYLDIFIHNEPTEQISENEKMCIENVCEKFGWNFGIKEGDIGLTYCCLHPIASDPNIQPFDLANMPIKLIDGTIKRLNVIDVIQHPNPDILM